MKPTVLILTAYPYEKQYFSGLEHIYRFLFQRFHFRSYPHSQANHIIKQLRKRNIYIDGVVGLVDETSALASLIAQNLGLFGTSPRSICLAQHKALFSRIASKINRYYPKTHLITHDSPIPHSSYPAFIKPSRGALSVQAYMIDSEIQLKKTLQKLKHQKRKLIPWFQSFVKQYVKNAPPVDLFLIQPFVEGKQYTVDGFVYKNRLQLLGFTESIYTKDRKSFERFDFPARLSQEIEKEVYAIVSKLVHVLGYNNAGFNMEFFVTSQNNIVLIEFNTRIAKQFIPLMKEHYKKSNLEMIIQIALGMTPDTSEKENKRMASSCVLRVPKDHMVVKVPTKKEKADIVKRFDLIAYHVLVKKGKKLSDYKQDAYTFRYAIADIAGESLSEIKQKFENFKKHSDIVLKEL